MTAVFDESVPITYNWNEPASPTAVGPTPVISPEPPAEDDSADVYPDPVTAEELLSVSQFREGSEAELISPTTAYAGYLMWGGVGEYLFTSQSTEGVPGGLPNALFGLEQSSDAREKGLSESLQTAVPNVLYTSKQPYNIYSMPVGTSPVWNEVGKHHVPGLTPENRTFAFFDAVLSFEQIVENATEEDLPAPLANALLDLHEINDEADEEGIPPPSESAIANADRLIRAIYDILPRQYLVELLPEGVIAITIPGGFRCSVMLLCESEGGILCSVNMNGKHQRNRYTHVDQLPDRFLHDALSKLRRE